MISSLTRVLLHYNICQDMLKLSLYLVSYCKRRKTNAQDCMNSFLYHSQLTGLLSNRNQRLHISLIWIKLQFLQYFYFSGPCYETDLKNWPLVFFSMADRGSQHCIDAAQCLNKFRCRMDTIVSKPKPTSALNVELKMCFLVNSSELWKKKFL